VSWHNNTPIRFHLGTLAIWARLTKNTVDLRDGVLQKLQDSAPALYKDLIEAPRPTTME
jgi:hypothetical protein